MGLPSYILGGSPCSCIHVCCISIYIYVYMFTHIHVCVYIYYIYTNVNMYMCTWIYLAKRKKQWHAIRNETMHGIYAITMIWTTDDDPQLPFFSQFDMTHHPFAWPWIIAAPVFHLGPKRPKTDRGSLLMWLSKEAAANTKLGRKKGAETLVLVEHLRTWNLKWCQTAHFMANQHVHPREQHTWENCCKKKHGYPLGI